MTCPNAPVAGANSSRTTHLVLGVRRGPAVTRLVGFLLTVVAASAATRSFNALTIRKNRGADSTFAWFCRDRSA